MPGSGHHQLGTDLPAESAHEVIRCRCPMGLRANQCRARVHLEVPILSGDVAAVDEVASGSRFRVR